MASSEESDTKSTTEEKTSHALEKMPTTFPDVGGLAIIAGLPESYLPLCGPETLSQYCCQFPSCTLEFSQKAAACNHICHDYLNVVLACLYCSI